MSYAGKGKPNILMIMTDQHRADWLSCAGTDYVSTASIDRIAKNGLRFKRASCVSPLCAPSRNSLAAGVYPHRLGILNNRHNFPLSRTTYYQLLRKNGYRVGVVGKTDLHKGDHFYGKGGNLPVMYHLGFTDPHETEGKMNAGRPKLNEDALGSFIEAGPYQSYLQDQGLLDEFIADMRLRDLERPLWHARPSVLDSEHFHDSYIGSKACEFIENSTEESPWHLFVSFVGPHDPWDAPAEYVRQYADKVYPDSVAETKEGKPAWVRKKALKQSNGMSREDEMNVKRHYAGAIQLIDEWIGKMLAVLEKKSMLENTVIVFCADHGEMLGDHKLFRKSVMYEGALRIPLIISIPEQRTLGESDALVELVDLHPTLLDLAGVYYSKDELDGQTLVPLLCGETDKHKAQQISLLHHCKMICDEEYKYIESYNDIHELYHISEDPEEQFNIACEQPAKVSEMRERLKNVCK